MAENPEAPKAEAPVVEAEAALEGTVTPMDKGPEAPVQAAEAPAPPVEAPGPARALPPSTPPVIPSLPTPAPPVVLEVSGVTAANELPPTHLGTQSAPGMTPSVEASTVMAGRYKVRRKLGEGATGAVFEVEHQDLKKVQAMKLLHDEIAQQPSFEARFQREAQTAAQLDHPNIVRVTDFGRTPDGQPFMVMEFLEGERLSAVLAEGPQSPRRAVELVDQLLLALEHAHAQGVVHRDVKPDNAILTPTGLKLLDFGLAKLRDAPAGETPLTREGMVFGTPRYMAPEQVTAEAVDARSDLYAVGVILWELLAGRPLFTGETLVEIMSKQVSTRPDPLHLTANADVDTKKLETATLTALEKMQKDRFQDAAAFRRALLECRLGDFATKSGFGLAAALSSPAGHSIAGTDPNQLRSTTTSTTGIWKRRLRNRSVWAALIVAGALVVGGRYVLETPLDKAKRALESGRLTEARPIVAGLLEQKPSDPALMMLSGHIAALEEQGSAAVDRYAKAIEADPTLATEPLLLQYLLALAKSNPKDAEDFAIKLTAVSTPGIESVLVELAMRGHRPSVRRAAYEGLERIDSTGGIDRFEYLKTELGKNESDTCAIRRWYVDRLIDLKDKRALPILQSELDRKGGLFNTERTGSCMQTRLSVAIKALQD